MKKILIIEPYYGGSHKSWADGLKTYSQHHIEILSMPARNWKWRMHGGAWSLAQAYLGCRFEEDLILVSSMIDLSTFLALTQKKRSAPVWSYFHENQFSYPKSGKDSDIERKRDDHYGFINLNTALCSEKVLFNSLFNRDSFLEGAQNLLSKIRDDYPEDILSKIKEKSHVLPIGVDIEKSSKKRSGKVIVWNHRWEHDKNPCEFFEVLSSLKKDQERFKLLLMGEGIEKYPKLNKVLEDFKEEIIFWGQLKGRKEYAEKLKRGDICFMSSYHDFFGLSLIECQQLGMNILLPNRQVYPERVEGDFRFLYNNLDEAKSKLLAILRGELTYNHRRDYHWKEIIKLYDEFFNKSLELRRSDNSNAVS